MLDLQKDVPVIWCSKIQSNKMQCRRLANRRMPDDTENTHALCEVCWLLSGSPKEYSEIVGD